MRWRAEPRRPGFLVAQQGDEHRWRQSGVNQEAHSLPSELPEGKRQVQGRKGIPCPEYGKFTSSSRRCPHDGIPA